MINRIRDIRRDLNLTLADVAARCAPPTTAQTIGRLETGMRQLSLAWMNRIAAAWSEKNALPFFAVASPTASASTTSRPRGA